MKCAIAKHSETLLELAIKHYRHTREMFVFISLYDDEEPFPLDEVISVLALKIEETKNELERWRAMGKIHESLETHLFIMNKNLKMLRKMQQQGQGNHNEQ